MSVAQIKEAGFEPHKVEAQNGMLDVLVLYELLLALPPQLQTTDFFDEAYEYWLNGDHESLMRLLQSQFQQHLQAVI